MPAIPLLTVRNSTALPLEDTVANMEPLPLNAIPFAVGVLSIAANEVVPTNTLPELSMRIRSVEVVPVVVPNTKAAALVLSERDSM